VNAGIIASRYATALYRYTASTGRAAEVCAQVERLLADPDSLKGMRLEPELQRFVSLLIENRRTDLLKFILQDFVDLYYRSAGIKIARLKTAVPVPTLEARLADLVRARTGCEVKMVCEVDPALVGGFVFTVDDLMLDASVARQIELIRRQFIEKNNRIV